MKLLRYGPPGREKPGIADREGNIRDLSKVITQIDDSMLAPRNLARLARVGAGDSPWGLALVP